MFDRKTIKTAVADQINRLPLTILAGFTGGLLFTWVQTLTGTTNIAQFLGNAVITKGGYLERFASPIGWTVHLTIALSYAVLFSTIYTLFLRHSTGWTRHVKILVAALGTGLVTTWIANPAISITISTLAGQGLPETIAPIYFKLGVPLWNHLIFFTYTAVLTGYVADALTSWTRRFLSGPAFLTSNATVKTEVLATAEKQSIG